MAAWDSRYVDVGGIRTHYLEAGRGPTLVLLHSGEFGGCAELSWEHNIGAFAEHCRVIAPDWLGFGRTDKLYDFAQGHRRVLSHMASFLREMRIDAADFVGNSMGGASVIRLADSKKVLVCGRLSRRLRHLGLGKLPGDFSFRWRGREVFVPLASSVLLSLLAAGIALLV